MSRSRPRVVTIKVDGEERVLFYAEEDQDGDITITPRSGLHYAESNTHIPEPGSEIVERHFSIHMSSNSPTRINAITANTVLQDGRKLRRLHYTRAIKQQNQFASIMAKRCPDLREEMYRLTPRERLEIVSLDSYRPQHFQLLYQIFIGPAGIPFSIYGQWSINVREIPFRFFNLVVVWSFMSAFSSPVGSSLSLYTEKPEIIENMEDDEIRHFLVNIPNGFDPAGCVEFFYLVRSSLRTQYFRVIEKEIFKGNSDNKALIFSKIFAAFFKSARVDTQEFREHFLRCELAVPAGDLKKFFQS